MTALFTDDDLAAIVPVLMNDAGHQDCAAWMVDGDGMLICACGKALFRFEAPGAVSR